MDYTGYGSPSPLATRRRVSVSATAPAASWDSLSGLQSGSSPGWAATHSAGSYGSSGNAELDNLRSLSLSDAAARTRGARMAAMNASPNDPSAAGFAGLSALLGGQSDTAHGLTQISGNLTQLHEQRAWQEHMARLEQQLQEEAYRRAHQNDWIGQVAGLAGTLGGAYVGGLPSYVGRR